MSSEKKNRPYDVVLFGATGFTGALVAEYLATKKATGVKWAMAGRDKAKLDAVKKRVTDIDSGVYTQTRVTIG